MNRVISPRTGELSRPPPKRGWSPYPRRLGSAKQVRRATSHRRVSMGHVCFRVLENKGRSISMLFALGMGAFALGCIGTPAGHADAAQTKTILVKFNRDVDA